jgi:hypothetical protein
VTSTHSTIKEGMDYQLYDCLSIWCFPGCMVDHHTKCVIFRLAQRCEYKWIYLPKSIPLQNKPSIHLPLYNMVTILLQWPCIRHISHIGTRLYMSNSKILFWTHVGKDAKDISWTQHGHNHLIYEEKMDVLDLSIASSNN